MSECSGNNSAAEKESSNIIPGCTDAASGEKGCTRAATTITKPTTTDIIDATGTNIGTTIDTTSKNHSPASKALIAPYLPQIIVASSAIDTATGAADIVIDQLSPSITKFEELFGKVKAIKDVNYIETNLKLKQAFQKEANKNALDTLLENYKKKNEGVNDENILIQNLTEFNSDIEKILKMGVTTQSGGKKIISRTNKSINQFLNPKITFANMLKSKRKRIIKGKSKKRRRNK